MSLRVVLGWFSCSAQRQLLQDEAAGPPHLMLGEHRAVAVLPGSACVLSSGGGQVRRDTSKGGSLQIRDLCFLKKKSITFTKDVF